MTTLNASITVVAGDDLDITRTVTGIPAGQTLAHAWFTVKPNPSVADPGLLQKEIGPLYVTGVGQITDVGSNRTGALLFQLADTETLGLPVGKPTPYDIKVLTSAGKIYTVEQGKYLSTARITQATS